MNTTTGESWKARPREREGGVQAQAVGITALGVDWVVDDKAEAYGPRLEGLSLWFLRKETLSSYL
jgi:hypothetical protein